MECNKIQISPATEADFESILLIQKEAFRDEAVINNLPELPQMNQTLEEISNDFEDYNYFVAKLEGKVIGSVRIKITIGSCFIGRLIVLPEYQNRKIGAFIMDYVEQLPGINRFDLFTGKKSDRNINFYKKRGYKIYDEFEEPGNVELVKMEKTI